MCLQTDTNTYAIHLPLRLERRNYHFYIPIYVHPENIFLFYYDYDEIVEANNRYCSKNFFTKRGDTDYWGNEPSVIDSFAIKNDCLYAYYKMNEQYIKPYHTSERYYRSYYNDDLDGFLSKIILEEDLINECKERYDMKYIDSIRNTFVNKEVYLSNEYHVEEEFRFYQCTDLQIKNIGKERPNYEYVIILTNKKNKSKDIIITKDNLKFLELADEYRIKKRIKEEKEEQEKADYEAKLAKEEAAYKAKLIRKYGKRNALLILDNKVILGFTKDMCIEAWGEPSDINRTITRYGTREQWVYGLGCYLYFEGNILSGIQD